MTTKDETEQVLLDSIKALATEAGNQDAGSSYSLECAQAAQALAEAYSWVVARSSRTS